MNMRFLTLIMLLLWVPGCNGVKQVQAVNGTGHYEWVCVYGSQFMREGGNANSASANEDRRLILSALDKAGIEDVIEVISSGNYVGVPSEDVERSLFALAATESLDGRDVWLNIDGGLRPEHCDYRDGVLTTYARVKPPASMWEIQVD